MGVIHGEWAFATDSAPLPDDIVKALGSRSGLAINCTYGDDGSLGRVEIPQIRESLFEWNRQSDCISVRSFIPAHPYLWTQLNAVMTEAGGAITDTPYAWHPEPGNDMLDRHWSALSKRQRFILGLPTFGAWRPLDFLAEREG